MHPTRQLEAVCPLCSFYNYNFKIAEWGEGFEPFCCHKSSLKGAVGSKRGHPFAPALKEPSQKPALPVRPSSTVDESAWFHPSKIVASRVKMIELQQQQQQLQQRLLTPQSNPPPRRSGGGAVVGTASTNTVASSAATTAAKTVPASAIASLSAAAADTAAAAAAAAAAANSLVIGAPLMSSTQGMTPLMDSDRVNIQLLSPPGQVTPPPSTADVQKPSSSSGIVSKRQTRFYRPKVIHEKDDDDSSQPSPAPASTYQQLPAFYQDYSGNKSGGRPALAKRMPAPLPPQKKSSNAVPTATSTSEEPQVESVDLTMETDDEESPAAVASELISHYHQMYTRQRQRQQTFDNRLEDARVAGLLKESQQKSPLPPPRQIKKEIASRGFVTPPSRPEVAAQITAALERPARFGKKSTIGASPKLRVDSDFDENDLSLARHMEGESGVGFLENSDEMLDEVEPEAGADGEDNSETAGNMSTPRICWTQKE